MVQSYRYLGVHLNIKLDWTDSTNALCKKGQGRLSLLRGLRSFELWGPLLGTFLDSVVALTLIILLTYLSYLCYIFKQRTDLNAELRTWRQE